MEKIPRTMQLAAAVQYNLLCDNYLAYVFRVEVQEVY